MSRRTSRSTRFSAKRQPKHYGGAVHLKGSDNYASKLTERDVKLARQLYKKGTQIKVLAKRFGVNASTMSLAVRRLTFRHVH
jgi:hypothetical protein